MARVEFEGVDALKQINAWFEVYNKEVVARRIIILHRQELDFAHTRIHIGFGHATWYNIHYKHDNDDFYEVGVNMFCSNRLTSLRFEFTSARVFVCDVRVNALGRLVPSDLARVVASFL